MNLKAELLELLTEFEKSEQYAEYVQSVQLTAAGMGFMSALGGQVPTIVTALTKWLKSNEELRGSGE